MPFKLMAQPPLLVVRLVFMLVIFLSLGLLAVFITSQLHQRVLEPHLGSSTSMKAITQAIPTSKLSTSLGSVDPPGLDTSIFGGDCSNDNFSVSCGSFCCADNTQCAADNTCRYLCPAAFPVDCGNGSCCPSGHNCTSDNTCAVLATPPPADASSFADPCSAAGQPSSSKTCPLSTGHPQCCPTHSACSADANTCHSNGWGCDAESPVQCLGTRSCCPAGFSCLSFGGCARCPSSSEQTDSRVCQDPLAGVAWCCPATSSCGPRRSKPCI